MARDRECARAALSRVGGRKTRRPLSRRRAVGIKIGSGGGALAHGPDGESVSTRIMSLIVKSAPPSTPRGRRPGWPAHRLGARRPPRLLRVALHACGVERPPSPAPRAARLASSTVQPQGSARVSEGGPGGHRRRRRRPVRHPARPRSYQRGARGPRP